MTPDKSTIILDDASTRAANRLWPAELKPERAAIPMSLYFSWVINAGLAAPDVYELDVVKHYQFFLSSPFDVIEHFGRKLTTEMMQPQCAEFSRLYYLHGSDHTHNYEEDLANHVVPHLPTIYHMDQTINNMFIVSAVIQRRFSEWSGSPKPYDLR
jgi:hypothetical protein